MDRIKFSRDDLQVAPGPVPVIVWHGEDQKKRCRHMKAYTEEILQVYFRVALRTHQRLGLESSLYDILHGMDLVEAACVPPADNASVVVVTPVKRKKMPLLYAVTRVGFDMWSDLTVRCENLLLDPVGDADLEKYLSTTGGETIEDCVSTQEARL